MGCRSNHIADVVQYFVVSVLAVAPTFGQSLSMVAIVNFIDLPIVGFLFGLLMALIPFKGLKYHYRYLRVSLWFILVVQSVEMLGLILMAIMKWRAI